MVASAPFFQLTGAVTLFMVVNRMLSCMRKVSVTLRPVVIGQPRISLIFLFDRTINALRTVALVAAVHQLQATSPYPAGGHLLNPPTQTVKMAPTKIWV